MGRQPHAAGVLDAYFIITVAAPAKIDPWVYPRVYPGARFHKKTILWFCNGFFRCHFGLPPAGQNHKKNHTPKPLKNHTPRTLRHEKNNYKTVKNTITKTIKPLKKLQKTIKKPSRSRHTWAFGGWSKNQKKTNNKTIKKPLKKNNKKTSNGFFVKPRPRVYPRVDPRVYPRVYSRVYPRVYARVYARVYPSKGAPPLDPCHTGQANTDVRTNSLWSGRTSNLTQARSVAI